MHTQIMVGAARADVRFVKASSSATEAKYETRRQTTEPPRPHPEADPTAIEPGDPLGEAHEDTDTRDALTAYVEKVGPVAMPGVQRGVTREDGSWVDLTDTLAELDDATRLEGVAIELTVPLSAIPRMWVRDSYYIVPSGPDAVKFLGYVWCGLRDTHSAAVVRWTKKTAQYLGAIVPVGTYSTPALVLLELEWAANRKAMPPMTVLDLSLVPDEGKAKAVEAMRAMARPPGAIEDLRDERAARRIELLAAARSGVEWKNPEPDEVHEAADDLGKALVAATA